MYGKVLVGTDGSDTARRAVDRAAEIATATGSTLVILSAGDEARAKATIEAEAERIAGTEAGADLAVETRVSRGEAADALVRTAQGDGVGLIVVGSQRMTGVGRILGSVPNKVAHHAPCHVLIVHTG